MRSLKIAGLCLASMLVMGMALAGNAAAVPLWLLCLQGTNPNNTKYSDSNCLKASSEGSWESVAIGTRSDTVRIAGRVILLLDHKATGGSSGVRCKEVLLGSTGLITGPNLLLVRKAEVPNAKTECERVEGGCKAGEVEKVGAVGLPWKSEGYETEGNFQGNILPDGGEGEPGWAVTCNTLLGKVTDTCRAVAGQPEVVTLFNARSGPELSELLVLGVFLGRRDATCTQGGTEAGLVRGEIAILLPGGHGLSINPK